MPMPGIRVVAEIGAAGVDCWAQQVGEDCTRVDGAAVRRIRADPVEEPRQAVRMRRVRRAGDGPLAHRVGVAPVRVVAGDRINFAV